MSRLPMHHCILHEGLQEKNAATFAESENVKEV